MPSVSSARLKAIIDAGPRQLLGAAGFRSRRSHFLRHDGESTAVISFQSSNWNTPESASFTVNVGRYFPKIATESGATPDDPLKARVFWGDCTPIGHIMPVAKDYWWKSESDQDVQEIAVDVSQALANCAFPFLERISTIDGVAEYGARIRGGLVRLDSLSVVTALRLVGRTEEARAIYKRIVPEGRNVQGVLAAWARANAALAG